MHEVFGRAHIYVNAVYLIVENVLLLLNLESDGVGELNLALIPGFRIAYCIKDIGRKHICAERTEIALCLGYGRLFHHIDNAVARRRYYAVSGHILDLGNADCGISLFADVEINQVLKEGLGRKEVVTQHNRKRLIEDVFARKNGIPETFSLILNDVGGIYAETLSRAEIVRKSVFVRADDEYDLFYARKMHRVNDMLDYRLVADRQEFLGDGVRKRSESCSRPCRGYKSFSYQHIPSLSLTDNIRLPSIITLDFMASNSASSFVNSAHSVITRQASASLSASFAVSQYLTLLSSKSAFIAAVAMGS